VRENYPAARPKLVVYTLTLKYFTTMIFDNYPNMASTFLTYCRVADR
jgi:hypothetical protein